MTRESIAAADDLATADRGVGTQGPHFGKAVWLLLFVTLAFALKASTFGDPNRHVDETFYFLVAQRMHEGLLVYVDVWDRKPLGLFLAYYLIAGISHSILAYQLVACALAAMTAFVIALIVERLGAGKGALLAGACYLFIIGPFEGSTGQTPDFYNLLIATSALLMLQASPALFRGDVGWRVWVVMALCGIALTFKQTTLFESLFLGLFLLYALHRSGASRGRIVRIAAICAVIGATPTLLIAGYYWQAGHWPEFWGAMVTSNLEKAKPGNEIHRSVGILLAGIVFFVLAGLGLYRNALAHPNRPFVIGWTIAAAVGFLSVPNFYYHYTLPLIVPLSVAAGLFLHRSDRRLIWLAVLIVYSIFWYSPNRSEYTAGSTQSMNALAKAIVDHDGGGGLLVFDAPPYLYALTGKAFLTPLAFPHHLNHAIEHNVSHLDTYAELDRVLAGKPGVIALEQKPRNNPHNWGSRKRVLDYAAAHCRHHEVISLREKYNEFPIMIFGDCAARGAVSR